MIKELLLMAVDKHHPDPVIDKAGSYKKGDVVCIKNEGHEWGRLEALTHFLVVKADLTERETEEFVKPETSPVLDTDGSPIVKTRRKYKFDFERVLGAEKLKAIIASGWRVEGIDKRQIQLKPDTKG